MDSFREVLSKKIDPVSVQYTYVNLFVYNFLHGLLLGNFSGLLSSIKSLFNLTTGQLGDILSTASIGAVVGLLFIPRLLVNHGSKISAFYGSLFFLFTYSMLTIASATNVYLGTFALICMGCGIVWMDSSLNTQAALMETIIGFPLFGRLQGVYSVGAIVGALISAQLVDRGYEVWEILSFATILYFPSIFLVVYFLLGYEEENLINQVRELEKDRLESLRRGQQGVVGGNNVNNTIYSDANNDSESSSDGEDTESESEPESHSLIQSSGNTQSERGATSSTQYGTVASIQTQMNNSMYSASASCFGWLFSRPPPPKADLKTLFVLAFILFIINFAESSVTYFSVLYLELWGVTETVAMTGFIAFELGLAISRFLSDWVVIRLGRKTIMVGGNAIAGMGLGIVALSGLVFTNATFALAASGFITVGLFAGPIVPVLLSFASNLKGFQPGDAIPLVTVFGICGLVIGPLVNGNLVDFFSYKSTFFIQALLMLIAAILAILTKERYRMKRPKSRQSPPEPASRRTSNTSQSEEVR